MIKKINSALFEQPGKRIEGITKFMVVVMAIIGIYLFIVGAIGFFTYLSYGIGDEDVAAGFINMIAGFFMVFGGYWLGILALGFAKVVRNAETELFLDEELFADETLCEGCTEESCEGCEAATCEGCEAAVAEVGEEAVAEAGEAAIAEAE